LTDLVINPGALEPLYGPADAPNLHRVKARVSGQPAEVRKGRRPTPIAIAQNLRREVAEWREIAYAGASDTSRELLNHWFSQSHTIPGPDGSSFPFSYYYCQREAIETLVYLYEVREVRSLSSLSEQFGSGDESEREIAALGVNPDDDLWPRYAFKVATGAGKTKIMSLAMVWSYFHALRESDSPMARHFVVIAPGITVFERLKEDFGNGVIFDRDPLIPTSWRGDWNVSVVLQGEAAGAATGGVIYLTNIHRLHDPKSRTKEAETYGFMGPPVSKTKALDTARALRERITSHPRLMVLNDEAHHVWDPDSAWNEAIAFLDSTTRKRGGGLVAQLDFSATPKDDKGNAFRHVIVDTPLGEAVDAGIVKTPIIGRGENLTAQSSDDAAKKYEHHLTVGYKRWLASKDEWEKSGKKALMFVMTEGTEAADQIARRLNTDPIFAELNGKTVNLHTNLKGKLRKRGKGATTYYEFVESEKEISDEDLRELRKLSRELDDSTSPYRCIVSVLMLREGWDVRNVTTIVPLRPLTAKAKILPEQTLGRGLRRMMPPGEGAPAEVVSVVEHPSFIGLYEEQLSQEGLPIEVVDIEKVPRTTVTIYPDTSKDLQRLDLVLPRLSPGYSVISSLDGLTFEAVREQFAKSGFKPLPLGSPIKTDIIYEGRHLITDEVVERMKISLPLLANGMGAVSFFRQELEHAARIRGQHAILADLIERFTCEVLFEERVTLFDQRVLPRLSHADVREHIRATFIPLILKAITRKEERLPEEEPQSVTSWKPFQVTHSERRPTVGSPRTPFNLAPCDNQLERAMVEFLTNAGDVASFAKNAGPQALRLDFLSADGRRSTYTPDFIVRDSGGTCYLAETKGRADADVAAKARAAVEWCKAASRTGRASNWEYLYVPEKVFEGASGVSIDELARTCRPALARLLQQAASPQQTLVLEPTEGQKVAEQVREFIDPLILAALPSRYRKAVGDAAAVFHFFEKKEAASFGACFQPLLGPIDHAAEALLVGLLESDIPAAATEQRDYFAPDLSRLQRTKADFLRDKATLLKRLLIHRSPLMPTGILLFCLEYAAKDEEAPRGIFNSVRRRFGPLAKTELPDLVREFYVFRNTYVAHAKADLGEREKARTALGTWISTVRALHAAVAGVETAVG
jgi:type III restriction enzyme